MNKPIAVARERDCATITLNRPPRNVLDSATLGVLREKLTETAKDHSIRSLAIASAIPGTFSAGNDIADHTAERAPQMLQTFHDIFRMLCNMDVITIACVDGVCLGGGAELALFCDFVITSDRSRFSFPEINVGCFPPVAAALLPLRIGTPRALRWILTGEDIPLEELRQCGLVCQVVPTTSIMGATQNLLEALRSKSTSVSRWTADLIRRSERREFLLRLDEAERVYLDHILHTHDASEGVEAFLQKRKPIWEHER